MAADKDAGEIMKVSLELTTLNEIFPPRSEVRPLFKDDVIIFDEELKANEEPTCTSKIHSCFQTEKVSSLKGFGLK